MHTISMYDKRTESILFLQNIEYSMAHTAGWMFKYHWTDDKQLAGSFTDEQLEMVVREFTSGINGEYRAISTVL